MPKIDWEGAIYAALFFAVLAIGSELVWRVEESGGWLSWLSL